MRKIGALLFLLKSLKFRHLRLGTAGLFRLASWHIRSQFKITDGNLDQLTNQKVLGKSNWALTPPTISILMTVFNQSRLELERAINSARIQKGTAIELLLIDDGSTRDETLQYLAELSLFKNEYLYRETNSGVVKARNYLINKCTTDFLVFLDPDDELCSNYIQSAISLLKEDRSIEIVFPNVLVHDTETLVDEVWGTGPFDQSVLQTVNTIPMSSIVSTRLIKSLDGYSVDFESGVEDWDLWYRASLSNAVAKHLPIIGYTYTKAPFSRTTIAKDNTDLIRLRELGPQSGIKPGMQEQVDLFLIVPFLPRIGGVEKYIQVLLEDFRDAGLKAALIVTEAAAIGYENNVEHYEKLAFTVLDRNQFDSDSLFTLAIATLSNTKTISINFGSPWAFNNSAIFVEKFNKNICFVFNTEISLQRAIGWKNSFDEFWVAYEGIKSKFPVELQDKVVTFYTGVIDNNQISRRTHSEGPFRVGYLGRLSPEKNPELFLRIAKVAENDVKFLFKMAGEGPLLDTVRKECEKLKNLSFLGFMEDPFEFLSGVDCLIITSDVEGIPLAAMEALSIGVPVISTDVGGMSELLDSPESGYIWTGKPFDAFQLIKQLQENSIKSPVQARLKEKFHRSTNSEALLQRVQSLKKD
jgi:glycosyltransferase involved in cell wall biosynthesis